MGSLLFIINHSHFICFVWGCCPQVVVPTVPANIFHVLRRQVHRAFRKPLVVFSPKRMLRLRQAMSSLEDIMEGTRFRRSVSSVSNNYDKGSIIFVIFVGVETLVTV